MCPMPRPTSRVHVHHQNARTWANFTSLVCIAILLSVVCYAPQERLKASRSGSPQNALHCLVTCTSNQIKSKSRVTDFEFNSCPDSGRGSLVLAQTNASQKFPGIRIRTSPQALGTGAMMHTRRPSTIRVLSGRKCCLPCCLVREDEGPFLL